MQDDLAEHVVASPGPGDVEGTWDETSRFENYWDDLNYNGDGYDDYEVKKRKREKKPDGTAKTTLVGGKRKAAHRQEHPSKRLKTKTGEASTTTTLDLPSLLWMNFNERSTKYNSSGKIMADFGEPVSLIPDWRERYKDMDGFPKVGSPTKLEIVADDDEDAADELYEGDGHPPISHGKRRQKEAEISQDEGPHEEMGDLHIDSDALKRALKEQLSQMGLKVNGLDEQTLLSFAERLFTGGGENADDIVGELADDLLGRDEEEETSGGLVDWVSKQVEAAHSSDEPMADDTDKVAKDGETKKEKSLLRQVLDPSQGSNAVEPWPPPELPTDKISPPKRKAEKVDDNFEAEAPQSKRRAPSYATPTAASKSKNVAPITANGGRKGKGRAK